MYRTEFTSQPWKVKIRIHPGRPTALARVWETPPVGFPAPPPFGIISLGQGALQSPPKPAAIRFLDGSNRWGGFRWSIQKSGTSGT